jgi:Cu/Ag efflux protein CusF
VSTRALSSVVGVALLTLVAVLAASVVGATAFGAAPAGDDPTRAAFELQVDADANRITLTHSGGDAVSVSDLRIRVRIDGEPLAHQPPVPFFATTGFVSGPTGPVNVADDDRWTAGERASFELAGTNAPLPEEGSQVTVALYLDDRKLAALETVA